MSRLIDAAYLPTLLPHFYWHHWATRKYGVADTEKLGIVPPRPKLRLPYSPSGKGAPLLPALEPASPEDDPPCLWVHAVSVGEAVSSPGLIHAFLEANPGWDFRVSVTTATGRKVAADRFGEDRVFYYPLDFSWMAGRALDRIRPSLVVLMELEIWPNFLEAAARRRIPVAVANVRITERSVRRLAWAPFVARRMAKTVDAWFAQTDLYAERLGKIGVDPARVEVLGSLKYDAVPVDPKPEIGREYRRLFGCPETHALSPGDRALVVAGSTHPTEEEAVLKAVRFAGERGLPEPKIVLVPRHPERLDEVEALAGRYGRVVRRSRIGRDGAGDAPIILGDTMGELAKMYAAADVVFIGGSLIRHGGQNFLEPCGLARPTVAGPHLWNFAEPAELLAGGGCLRIVETADALAETMAAMLADPAGTARMGAMAREILLAQRGATKRMAERLSAMAGKARAGT